MRRYASGASRRSGDNASDTRTGANIAPSSSFFIPVQITDGRAWPMSE